MSWTLVGHPKGSTLIKRVRTLQTRFSTRLFRELQQTSQLCRNSQKGCNSTKKKRMGALQSEKRRKRRGRCARFSFLSVLVHICPQKKKCCGANKVFLYCFWRRKMGREFCLVVPSHRPEKKSAALGPKPIDAVRPCRCCCSAKTITLPFLM